MSPRYQSEWADFEDAVPSSATTAGTVLSATTFTDTPARSQLATVEVPGMTPAQPLHMLATHPTSGPKAPPVTTPMTDDVWAPIGRRPWPQPLAHTALHALAGRFVKLVEPHTEADAAGLLAGFLVTFGNAVGGSPYFEVEAVKHHANLFALLVGRTGRGRKDTAAAYSRRLFQDADPEYAAHSLLAGLQSGEGLAQAVTKLGDDKRVMVRETEFASVLKTMGRENATLSEALRQSWDTGDLRVATRHDPIRVHGAHISLLGHITSEELERRLETVDAANGFANRFLCFAVRASKWLPEGGAVPEDEWGALVTDVRQAVERARTIGRVRRDEATSRLWAAAYPDLSRGRPGLLGAALSRAEAQVTRLSLVYALLDGSTLIRPDHHHAAMAVWRYVEDSTAYVLGDSLGDPAADRILAALRGAPEGKGYRDLHSLFSQHSSRRDLDRSLSLLLELQLIGQREQRTAGRPKTVFFVMEPASKANKGDG